MSNKEYSLVKTHKKAFFFPFVLVVIPLVTMVCARITPPTLSSTPTSRQPDPTLTPVTVPTSLPGWDELQSGWNQLVPGSPTVCARGGGYVFFVRKSTSDKLLIFFEGGGNCFDYETCRMESHRFDDSIEVDVQADNPALKTMGIFDLNDSHNPFKDYNIVFVGYCTGDGYLGHKTVMYESGGDRYSINHVGFINAQVALSWTYQNIPSPKSVFVLGCSAGTIGSAFHSPYIMQNYLGTQVTVVGDSGGGFIDGPAQILQNLGTIDLLPGWIPEYRGLSETHFPTSSIFTIPAKYYPKNVMALLDTTDDSTQAGILTLLGNGMTLTD